jgi:hypothetical protein
VVAVVTPGRPVQAATLRADVQGIGVAIQNTDKPLPRGWPRLSAPPTFGTLFVMAALKGAAIFFPGPALLLSFAHFARRMSSVEPR